MAHNSWTSRFIPFASLITDTNLPGWKIAPSGYTNYQSIRKWNTPPRHFFLISGKCKHFIRSPSNRLKIFTIEEFDEGRKLTDWDSFRLIFQSEFSCLKIEGHHDVTMKFIFLITVINTHLFYQGDKRFSQLLLWVMSSILNRYSCSSS